MRPVEDGAPTDGGDVAQTQEFQSYLGQNRVNHRANQSCGHNRNLVGKNLSKDDAQRGLSTGTSRLYEFTSAQREGLGTQHARTPRPACDGHNDGNRQWSSEGEVGSHDNGKRYCRDDEKDVDDE